jgi:hypothetical protein
MGFWPRSFQSSLHEPLLHINQGSRVLHLFVAGDLPLCDGLVSLYCKEVAKFRGRILRLNPSSFKVNDQDRYYLYPLREVRLSFSRVRLTLFQNVLNKFDFDVASNFDDKRMLLCRANVCTRHLPSTVLVPWCFYSESSIPRKH